jgi:hypothetical protein
MRVETWKTIVDTTAEHPLLAAIVVALVAVTILLGGLHELELAGRVLIVFVQEVKKRLSELRQVGRDLWYELTTWKDDQ